MCTYLPKKSEESIGDVCHNSLPNGKHLFRAGLDINWERPYYLSVPQQSWGNWNFTGYFTGNKFGDFLLGLPLNTSITVVRPQTQISEVNWATGGLPGGQSTVPMCGRDLSELIQEMALD
jgi:hypothetical protein